KDSLLAGHRAKGTLLDAPLHTGRIIADWYCLSRGSGSGCRKRGLEAWRKFPKWEVGKHKSARPPRRGHPRGYGRARREGKANCKEGGSVPRPEVGAPD